MSKPVNEVLGEYPCMRCAQVITWKRNAAGAPYGFCLKAGGCGARTTLGASDPFPGSLKAGQAAPAPAKDKPKAGKGQVAKDHSKADPEGGQDVKEQVTHGGSDTGNPWIFGD